MPKNLSCSLSMQDRPDRQESGQLTNVLRFALAFGVPVCVCVTKGDTLGWAGASMERRGYAQLASVRNIADGDF